MKAIRIHEYGDASTLRYEDASMPTLQPDDVLIRVAATSLYPIDALKPKTLSFVQAAALPMVAQTALTALRAGELRSGQTS